MTWDNVDLTERIRYLQEWTPCSQRHQRSRKASATEQFHNKGAPHSLDKKSGSSLADFFVISNMREEIGGLKKKIEGLSAEASSLRKAKRDLEASIVQAKQELAESEAKFVDAEFAASEARARMLSLDQDVEKLCELSKLLSEENASLEEQIKERDMEIKGLKAAEKETIERIETLTKEFEVLHSIRAENEFLHKELEELSVCRVEKEELAEEVERLANVEADKEELEKAVKQIEGEKDALKKEVERLNGVKADKIERLNSVKAEREALQREVERLCSAEPEREDKLKEMETLNAELLRDLAAVQKLVDEMRVERDVLHSAKKELKVQKETLHNEKEALHGRKEEDFIRVLIEAKQAEDEKERLQKELTRVLKNAKQAEEATESVRVELAMVKEERDRLVTEAEEATKREAEFEEHIADMEEDYEAELKHLSEDVARATQEMAAERDRANKLVDEMEELHRGAAGRGTLIPPTSGEELNIAELSRQLSSVLFYRESSPEADHLVQVEFEKMTGSFSRGLLQVEEEIARWKERVTTLEAALTVAKESAVSSQRTANHLLGELTAVTQVLKGPSPLTTSPPSSSSTSTSTTTRTKRRAASVSNIVPATVASGALAGGLYAAVKLLKAKSFS